VRFATDDMEESIKIASNRLHNEVISLNITVDYREKASGLIDLLKTENISIEVKKVC
jgi:ERCC4-type nuclease